MSRNLCHFVIDLFPIYFPLQSGKRRPKVPIYFPLEQSSTQHIKKSTYINPRREKKLAQPIRFHIFLSYLGNNFIRLFFHSRPHMKLLLKLIWCGQTKWCMKKEKNATTQFGSAQNQKADKCRSNILNGNSSSIRFQKFSLFFSAQNDKYCFRRNEKKININIKMG